MKYIGVDGCKGGWVVVGRKSRVLTYRILSSIYNIVDAFPKAERILIDIPIGLPWKTLPVRPCDSLARQKLGSDRRLSVFPVPCREAVHASNIDAARNLNKKIINRSIAAQTWSITPKIAEVDNFLLSNYLWRARIREIHPEVCFWALAGKRAMTNKKSIEEGHKERLQVLRSYETGILDLLDCVCKENLRKDVAADDVLDAAAAFVTAEAQHGELSSLIGNPTHDQRGLPMEMVYLKI